jgi:hypothetical protein
LISPTSPLWIKKAALFVSGCYIGGGIRMSDVRGFSLLALPLAIIIAGYIGNYFIPRLFFCPPDGVRSTGYPARYCLRMRNGRCSIARQTERKKFLSGRIRLNRRQIVSVGWEGRNSSLDEIQAAVLNIKLKYFDEDNNLRKTVVKEYINGIKNPTYIAGRKIQFCIHRIRYNLDFL